MMAVSYERYENDIEEAEDNVSTASEDEVQDAFPYQSTVMTRKQRNRLFLQDKWPMRTGLLQILAGFIILALGCVQVFFLPLKNDNTGEFDVVRLAKNNCYGVGLWTGALLVITGSLGVRAAIHNSVSTVYIYFVFVMLDLLLYTAAILLLLISYSQGWTTRDVYEDDGHASFYTQLATSLAICVGYVIIILAFVQYYEDVFCGDLQLCRHWLHCCAPCWCPRVPSQEELLAENAGRPPSLPV